MTDQPAPTIMTSPPAPIATEQQGIQAANSESVAKSDPLTAGLAEPVKIEGPAQAAPIAAPPQQIAPVSANGDQTSARTSPIADVPAIAPTSSEAGAAALTSAGSPPNPPDAPASSSPAADTPALVGEPLPTEVPTEVSDGPDDFGDPLTNVPERSVEDDPRAQAEKLLGEIPGRLRLY